MNSTVFWVIQIIEMLVIAYAITGMGSWVFTLDRRLRNIERSMGIEEDES